MKPLYQARYRGKPEWDWEYTTRGYTITDLETAKKPAYKWLAEAKKRNKPLQVQVVIVDPEKRWGEVIWEDFYLKDEFYKDKEAERCQIAKDITKDLLEEQCKIDDDKCRIATEIMDKVVKKECNPIKVNWNIRKLHPDETLEWMSPESFLAKVPHPLTTDNSALVGLNLVSLEEGGQGYDICSLKSIHKRILEDKELDALELDYIDMWYDYPSHEGRHRAVVCYKLNIDKVPVIVRR